jgi:hypothetical protein
MGHINDQFIKKIDNTIFHIAKHFTFSNFIQKRPTFLKSVTISVGTKYSCLLSYQGLFILSFCKINNQGNIPSYL